MCGRAWTQRCDRTSTEHDRRVFSCTYRSSQRGGDTRAAGQDPEEPAHAFSAPRDAGWSTSSERRRLTWSRLQPAYRSPAYRCPACCDRCQQVLSTGGASNTGSGGRLVFRLTPPLSGPKPGCVQPARSRGGPYKRRAGVAASSQPAQAVVEGHVRLVAFSASHRCPPTPRTAPHCADGQLSSRQKSSLKGAHVPPKVGDAAAAFACRAKLCTPAVTPYLEHSLQLSGQLWLMKWFVEAATLRR